MKNRFKWVVSIVLIITCVLFLSSCRSYDDAVEIKKDFAGGYFKTLLEWSDQDGDYAVAYAKDTKVKYFIWFGYYKGTITPLYNADGTLQIYTGE